MKNFNNRKIDSDNNNMSLVTVIEGDPNASFSIAISPRSRSECYSFLEIAPLSI